MPFHFAYRQVIFLLGMTVLLPPVYADEPEFVQHTPADRDSFFYIADPLPHIEAAVESVAFARLSEVVNGMAPSPMPEPEQILSQLQLGTAYIPTEIAVTTTGKEISTFGRLMRIFVLMSLCEGAIEAEEQDELPSLHEELAEQLKKMQIHSSDLWLNFRSPIPAAIVYGQATALATQWESQGIAEVEFDEGIHLKLTAKSWLEDEFTAKYFMHAMDVTESLDSPGAVTLAQATMQLKLSVHLQQHGNAIRLSIGDEAPEDQNSAASTANSKDSSEAAAGLFGDLNGTDDSLLVAGRYEVQALRSEITSAAELWKKWKGTPVGDATQALDTDDFMGDLKDMVQALKVAGDAGSFVIYADNGLRGTWTEFGVPDSPTLKESGLLNLLPDSQGIVSASSMISLGQSLSDMLSQFESRLATKSLQYELSGRQLQAEMTDMMSEFYYQKLTEFRRLVKTDAVNSFAPPLASIMDVNGTISELAISFEGEQGSNELVLRNLQCPRFAVIGRFKPGKDVRSLVGEIWKSFYNGVSQENFDFEAIVADSTKLQHPAWFFTSEWQTSLPQGLRVSAGGIEPHFFIIDEQWFVFSTNPEFSREILAESKNSESRISLPANVTGFGRVPMRVAADSIRAAADGIARIVADPDNIVLTGFELERFQRMIQSEQGQRFGLLSGLEFVSTVVEIMDSVSWESTVLNRNCRTEFRVEFPEF